SKVGPPCLLAGGTLRRYHLSASSNSLLYRRTSAALTPRAAAIRSKCFCEYVGTGSSAQRIISPRGQNSRSKCEPKFRISTSPAISGPLLNPRQSVRKKPGIGHQMPVVLSYSTPESAFPPTNAAST